MKYITLIFIYLFVLIKPVFSENQILINEFLIDPQPQQVEIINKGSTTVDISGWFLDDTGGLNFATIPNNSIIYPNSCFVFSGDLNLNKSSSDTIRLFDNTAHPSSSAAKLIDSYSYKSSPEPGYNLLRLPDGGNWTASISSIGFFNSNNQSCVILPTPTPTPMPTPTITPSTTATPGPTSQLTPTTEIPPTTYQETTNNIFISEVMIHPRPQEHEWIEIYNNNDFTAKIDNWYIDDFENSGSLPKKFTAEIKAFSYYVLDLTSSIFNNDNDQVRLLDQNKKYKDGFEYDWSAENISYGRYDFESQDFCKQNPSKYQKNEPCLSSSNSTQSPTLSPTSTPTKSVNSKISAPTVRIITDVKRPKQISSFNYPNKDVENDGQILGVNTDMNKKDKYLNSAKFSLVVSVFYSILTIVHISIKMKLLYEKYIRLYSPLVYSKRRK